MVRNFIEFLYIFGHFVCSFTSHCHNKPLTIGFT